MSTNLGGRSVGTKAPLSLILEAKHSTEEQQARKSGDAGTRRKEDVDKRAGECFTNRQAQGQAWTRAAEGSGDSQASGSA